MILLIWVVGALVALAIQVPAVTRAMKESTLSHGVTPAVGAVAATAVALLVSAMWPIQVVSLAGFALYRILAHNGRE